MPKGVYTRKPREPKEPKPKEEKPKRIITKEKRAEYNKRYLEKNREKKAEHNKKWRDANKDYAHEYIRKYYQENKQHIDELNKKNAIKKKLLNIYINEDKYTQTTNDYDEQIV